MRLEVTVQIEGRDVRCGTVYQNVRHGVESVTFSYDADYLANEHAFSLSPDLPLEAGTYHSQGFHDLRAFEDAMPDRWGRNLLLREERSLAREEHRTERSLFDADLLTGVSDETRQGALRIWDGNVTPLAVPQAGVPKEVSIPDLLDASDLASQDLEADVRDLVEAGSSLGGARPKASVQSPDGSLCIAKFPKSDEGPLVDAEAWEQTMLVLMGKCGISVPRSRILRVRDRSVLLMQRFDRRDKTRVPYISGMTAAQGNDGGNYSYLDLVDFIETEGSHPERDLPELWRQALFSCAVGNTDNHLRNYGFLHDGKGWRLAPAFDVNPTPGDGDKYLATALDFGRPEADARIAFEVAEYFRVSKAESKEVARKMLEAMRGWRKAAMAQGISDASVRAFASNFQSGVSMLEKCL